MEEFIQQLNFNIDLQKKINANPKAFIKSRNITLYNCTKTKSNKIYLNHCNITENDLPIEASLGTVFLIKGANILELHSYCDYNYSIYLQINTKQPAWIGKVAIINIAPKDPENIKFLLDGSDTFYQPSNWYYLIIQFLHSGFQLYLK